MQNLTSGFTWIPWLPSASQMPWGCCIETWALSWGLCSLMRAVLCHESCALSWGPCSVMRAGAAGHVPRWSHAAHAQLPSWGEDWCPWVDPICQDLSVFLRGRLINVILFKHNISVPDFCMPSVSFPPLFQRALRCTPGIHKWSCSQQSLCCSVSWLNPSAPFQVTS